MCVKCVMHFMCAMEACTETSNEIEERKNFCTSPSALSLYIVHPTTVLCHTLVIVFLIVPWFLNPAFSLMFFGIEIIEGKM